MQSMSFNVHCTLYSSVAYIKKHLWSFDRGRLLEYCVLIYKIHKYRQVYIEKSNLTFCSNTFDWAIQKVHSVCIFLQCNKVCNTYVQMHN